MTLQYFVYNYEKYMSWIYYSFIYRKDLLLFIRCCKSTLQEKQKKNVIM